MERLAESHPVDALPIRLIPCDLCGARLASSDELSLHYAGHFRPGKCVACAEQLVQIDERIYHLQLASTCTYRPPVANAECAPDRGMWMMAGIDVKREPKSEELDVNMPTSEELLVAPTANDSPTGLISQPPSPDHKKIQMIDCKETLLEEGVAPTAQHESTRLRRRLPPKSAAPRLTASGKPRKKPERRDPRTFECFICKRIVNHLPNLRRHIEQQHGHRLTCEICGKKLATYSYLKGHMKTHSASKEFVCSCCGKSFHHQFNMLAHMVVHTGVKTHKCHECNKMFGTRSNLLNHRRVHTGEKPYKCSIADCTRAYMYSIDLKRHLYGAHGIYTNKFECKVCGKILPENKLLVAHMKVHGETM